MTTNRDAALIIARAFKQLADSMPDIRSSGDLQFYSRELLDYFESYDDHLLELESEIEVLKLKVKFQGG